MPIKEAVEKAGIHKLPNYVGHSNVFHTRLQKGQIIKNTKVIRIYVSSKTRIEILSPLDIIPKTLNVDGIVYETDVVQLNAKALSLIPPLSEKTRPVSLGYSFGHYLITAGTVGAVLYYNKNPYFITNNHVAANQSSIQTIRAHIGDAVLQSGPYDGGKFSLTDSGDSVGSLYAFIPLDETGNNIADVAMVSPLDPDLVNATYGVPINSALTGFNETYTIGESLRYIGRTSGYKTVTIDDPSANIVISYESFSALFEDVVTFNPSAIGGDSGSGLLTIDNKLSGLVFAGDTTNGIGIACKINNILAEFQKQNIILTWQAPTTPPPPPPLGPNTIKFISYNTTTYAGYPAIQVTLENDYALPNFTTILMAVAKNNNNQTCGITTDTFVFNNKTNQLTGVCVFSTLSYGVYNVNLFCLDKTMKIPISPTVELQLVYS